MSAYAGILLAGGDGTRLSALTRRLAGDERPNQFCRLITAQLAARVNRVEMPAEVKRRLRDFLSRAR